MRTITQKINIYKFNELSGDIQKKLCQKFKEQDQEMMQEQFNQLATNRILGNAFHLNDFNYSLSYCQGDGFSFTIHDMNEQEIDILLTINFVDLDENELLLLNKLQKNKDVEYYLTSKRNNHRYFHEYSVDLELVVDGKELTSLEEKVLKGIENKIKDEYIRVCNGLEKDGYDLFYNAYELEEMKEICESMDYEFLIDGTIWSAK